MRAYNERLVLTLVRQAGTLSKTGIARLTGLSAQTVSVIMRSLEADGLLKKDQPIRGKVGQPLMPMSLERNGAFFLGLRIGRRSLDLVLTDFLGHVESRIHLPHRYPTPDGVVRFANDGIGRLLDRLPAKHRARVAGLGIAIPFRLWDWAMPPGVEPRLLDRLPAEHRARVAGLGIAIPFRLWDWAMPPGVEPRLLDRLPAEHRARVAGLGIAIPFRLWDWAMPLGVELSDMADWRDRDIVTEIAEGRDFPVYLRNDASAACGAELVFGEKNKPRDFLYFFVGFFVGGGLVLDNVLYTGRSGNAAALGSVPIEIRGNNVRQLVDAASLASLERALIAQGGNGDMIWENPDDWTVPGDILEDWLDKAANGLAHAIISSACLIDFECALIDGWMPEEVRAELVRRTARRLGEISVAGIDVPEIREGTIGHDARSLGAASLPLSERFLVDRSAFLKGWRT